jgi:hypothetical protein
MQTRVSPQSVWPDLGVSASPSRARSNRAARLTWSRQPRGRPAGLPDRPLANRPRRCRASCFPCFIWSRSGIGNSFNRNCTRLRVPTPRRLQCEYGDWMIIYLSSPLRANRQQADCETLIGTRSFYRSARSFPNSIEFQGSLCERKRMRGLPFGARLAGRIQLSRLRQWPSLASPSRSLVDAFRTSLVKQKSQTVSAVESCCIILRLCTPLWEASLASPPERK